MIFKIFSVHDAKAENYMPPFFQSNENLAKRTFGDAVAQADHPFHRNCNDYTLCMLGTYDDMTGLISPSGPEKLLNASEVKVMLDALDHLKTPAYDETDLPLQEN